MRDSTWNESVGAAYSRPTLWEPLLQSMVGWEKVGEVSGWKVPKRFALQPASLVPSTLPFLCVYSLFPAFICT